MNNNVAVVRYCHVYYYCECEIENDEHCGIALFNPHSTPRKGRNFRRIKFRGFGCHPSVKLNSAKHKKHTKIHQFGNFTPIIRISRPN